VTGWRALRAEDVEAIPWRGTELVWRPLRAALGLRAFGAGAYTASQVGQCIVEPHTESADGRGHEEVYVVVAGRVRFTLDGEIVDAPVGTCVFVAPAAARSAVAKEVPATVLAFGAEPGVPYTPAGGEWTDRARAFVHSDPARARRVLEEGRAEVGETPGLLIGIALLAAAEGREDAARDTLARAIAGNPAVRRAAAEDPDLARLLAAGGTTTG
jgi:mannose-6-phosphate isomerase-like protein (cupin superfamily)